MTSDEKDSWVVGILFSILWVSYILLGRYCYDHNMMKVFIDSTIGGIIGTVGGTIIAKIVISVLERFSENK